MIVLPPRPQAGTPRQSPKNTIHATDPDYDADGQKTFDVAKLDQAGTTGTLDQRSTFSYTPAGQLAGVDKTGADAGDDETYTYDAAGNTTEQVIGAVTTTSNFDRNRLTNSAVTGNGTTYSRYDSYGRLISRDNAGQVLERYAYDGFDRTTREQRFNSAGVLQLTKTQSFDPFDRTASQTTAITGKPTKDLRFTYLGTSDQIAVEEEKNTSGTWKVSKNYAYGPDGSKLQLTDTPVNGTTTKTQYYGTNPHGDIETMTSTDGTTASTYRYTAYGQPDTKGTTGEDAYSTAASETDKMAADLDNVNPYRFSGKRIHGGTGTYDIGFRDYDPGINRFLTRDFYQGALNDLALGTDPWNTNRYAFSGGNPIGGIELDGHMTITDTGGGGSAPAPTNAPGCGTWGLAACNSDPERKVDPVVEGMVSTGDGGDALGGAANSAIGLAELTPFSGLVNAFGLDDYARDTVNEKLDVDTTTNAYVAGGITFDVATAFVGGGGGAAVKGTKTLASEVANAARTGARACSFSGATLVLMADGTRKPIEKVEVGDKIIATDPETGEQVAKAVEGTIRHWDRMSDLVLADGTVLATTEDHPFWSVDDQRFERADEFGPGDRVMGANGRTIRVAGLRWVTGRDGWAYNLAVEGIHTYHVGNDEILVHNTCKVVFEGQGGRFGDMSPGTPGDGLTPHHMPQNALGFLPRNDGGAIVMKQGDHELTRTYGTRGRATKQADAGLSFRDALAQDLWDIRRIGEAQYGDPGYYNQGIMDMLAYYRSVGVL